MSHWNNDNMDNFTAYMVSHDTINLTYKGEITKEIYELQFLKFDAFEEILFIKQEETAVSLPWASTIIINFWDIQKDKYSLFNIYDGIKTLFQMDIIKSLKEVQFKFFSEEQLDSLIKLKWIQSDNTNYFYFEILEENSFQLNLQWRDSDRMDKQELDRQFLQKDITKLLKFLGTNNDIENQLKLLETVLAQQYDSIYFYFPSNIKLKIHTKIFDETQEQLRSIEIFIHDGWFESSKYDLIFQYQNLHSLLQNYMNNSEEEFVLDIALIFNEEQIQCSQLMSQANSLIIKTLLSCSMNINSILLSLMPVEIHFELNIQKDQFNLDINLHHEDPQDLYQEGLVILLQALTNCKIFQELNVDIYQDEQSNNRKFQLFPFVMVIKEFQQYIKGTLSYNCYQLLPRTGPVSSKGIVNFLVTDNKSIYQIAVEKHYLDLQKEINCFLQYLQIYAKDSTSIIISCDLCELQQCTSFCSDTFHQVISFLSLQEFGLLDCNSRDSKDHEILVKQLLLPIMRYLFMKKKIAIIQLIFLKSHELRMRKEMIHEMIEQFLPIEYHCLMKN